MNLLPLLYVGFRLTPFVIVSFFVMSSLMTSDIRGIIFLGFLLLNCVFTFSIAAGLKNFLGTTIPEDKNAVCNALSLSPGIRLSVIPLNINVISFTFAYLVYLIAKYKKELNNLPLIIFFPILLLSTIVWEVSNMCVSPVQALVSLILGACLGVGFAEAVDVWSGGVAELQYFGSITNTEMCKQVTNEVFECKVE
jgi:hypothetical protein